MCPGSPNAMRSDPPCDLMLPLVAELEGKVGFGSVGSGCLKRKGKEESGEEFVLLC